MFEIIRSDIPGCVELCSIIREDERGRFVKTIHSEVFEDAGLSWQFSEQYYSVSYKNVFRGLHFQLPPHDHDKLVYCVSGEALDVVVDVRKGSPTYGQHQIFNLSSERANQIYIPSGLAHGFLSLSEEATLVYNVTSVYAPDHDAGIHFSCIRDILPAENPVVSERDNALPDIDDFDSPFTF